MSSKWNVEWPWDSLQPLVENLINGDFNWHSLILEWSEHKVQHFTQQRRNWWGQRLQHLLSVISYAYVQYIASLYLLDVSHLRVTKTYQSQITIRNLVIKIQKGFPLHVWTVRRTNRYGAWFCCKKIDIFWAMFYPKIIFGNFHCLLF